MSKRIYIFMLYFFFAIGMFTLVAYGVRGTTLGTRAMETNRGSLDWGDYCTCGFETGCGECVDLYDLQNSDEGSTYCDSSNEMFMYKRAAYTKSCDCAGYIDCGNFWSCEDAFCEEECARTSGCKGCNEYVDGCDECDLPE